MNYALLSVSNKDGIVDFARGLVSAGYKLISSGGTHAVIQPGGSIKDQESIDACNELDMTMILTGKRHFLH